MRSKEERQMQSHREQKLQQTRAKDENPQAVKQQEKEKKNKGGKKR